MEKKSDIIGWLLMGLITALVVTLLCLELWGI